jgi:hypothetical protein
MPAEESDRFSASALCALLLVVIGLTAIGGYLAAIFTLLRHSGKCASCLDDDYLDLEEPDLWATSEMPRH